MTQSSDATPLSRATRIAWAALILLTLYLSYFHNLGVIGLVGPDEPRYAWIARDMSESGDWITPRLYGQPWFEKPPLYYWTAAISFKFFGVSEISARLPGALAALFATLTLAWLALRAYGAETARWLLLLLPTTVGMIGFSHAAATDMPFAAALTVAMVFAAQLLKIIPLQRTTHEGSPPALRSFNSFTSFTSSTSFTSAGLGLFLGLATLAKGPAALILAGGPVFLWALLTKRWRDAFRCLHPIAIAAFCLTALPWYILCAHRNPDFFRVFIIEHNFKRFLTPEFQHVQPFWFYLPVLLIAFLPWTLALLWSVAIAIFRYLPSRRPSPLTLLLLCWSCFCLFFFTLSKSKLPGYILPAVPAVGLLLSRAIASLLPQEEKSFRWLLSAFSLLTGLVAAVLTFKALPFNALTPRTSALVATACILLFFGLANLLLANKENQATSLRLAAPLSVLPILLLLCTFPLLAGPWLHSDPSGKSLATELAKNKIPADRLFVQTMQRGQQFSLSFYLHKEIQIWDPQNPKEGWLLLKKNACEVKAPWACSASPVEISPAGWFAYQIRRETDGAAR